MSPRGRTPPPWDIDSTEIRPMTFIWAEETLSLASATLEIENAMQLVKIGALDLCSLAFCHISRFPLDAKSQLHQMKLGYMFASVYCFMVTRMKLNYLQSSKC